MSDNEDFQDPSSFVHLLIALVVLLAMPLLPMLSGWFTLLS